MFHNIQALLDILQRSHIFYLLILFFNIRNKGIYNLFELVPLFKRFIYRYKTETLCFDNFY